MREHCLPCAVAWAIVFALFAAWITFLLTYIAMTIGGLIHGFL